MKLRINHFTHYEYSSVISLGVHRLYLLPQFRTYLSVSSQNLRISPNPAGFGDRMDLVGNSFRQTWFNDLTDSLKIESELTIETKEFNPFDFIIDPDFLTGSMDSGKPVFSYSLENQDLISSYIRLTEFASAANLLNSTWEGSSGVTDWLARLTNSIYQNWNHLIRHEENIWDPGFTFSNGGGSCRDLAWMEMMLLRQTGLATRFVSGYAFNPNLDDGHELHAWLEVYLPGAGWIGLDPSLGLLTDHHYIPLATHPEPRQTLPVQGTFAGTATAELHTRVDLELLKG
jgi:transglutaminase-like putative cysteine protease